MHRSLFSARAPRASRLARPFIVAAGLSAALAAPSAALAADTQAPVVVSSSASPSWVNVTGSAQPVTVTFRVTDDDSGVVAPVVSGDSDLSKETTPAVTATRISGTAKDGTYQAKIVVGKGAVGGGWTASALKIADAAGNAISGSPKLGTFTVFAFGFDTVAPKLVSSSIEPSTVDVTNAGASVTVTAVVTDDYAGAQAPTVEVTSPDGSKTSTIGSILLSGDAHEGTWVVPISVPKDAQAGAWNVRLRPLRDLAGNTGVGKELGKVTVTRAPAPGPTTPTTTTVTPGPAPGSPAPAATKPVTDPGQGGVAGIRANSKSFLTLATKSKTAKTSAKGKLTLSLKCNGVVRCKGSVRLYKKVGGKKIKVVSRRVSVAAGKTVKVKFSLTKKGFAALRRGKKAKTTVSVWTDGIKAPRSRSITLKRS